jgi:hypothetical protein
MLPIRADMESAPTKGYGLCPMPALLATLYIMRFERRATDFALSKLVRDRTAR